MVMAPGCQVPRLGFRIAILFILGIRRHSRSFDDDDDEAQSERYVTAAVGGRWFKGIEMDLALTIGPWRD